MTLSLNTSAMSLVLRDLGLSKTPVLDLNGAKNILQLRHPYSRPRVHSPQKGMMGMCNMSCCRGL